ncbi:zinc finger CCCH domain-containing protein 4-like isoform X2 [Lytechinus variegatus]|uniref:zinc finger CCCH domain-containing protein 4-like isoform X2 n=1 Tax=Lytechinus variegatus TaxID=7654 RepID=UPI001BB199B0|nr:zinc finger CCCH domain-containing protein 4-like isoform X2 [Lytechinus variegatus]
MALETLFETPPPLVSCENKESLNEGSERNPEEDGEILEDGELSDDVGGVQQTDEMGNEEEGYMDGGGGNYGYENDAGVEEEMEEQEQVFETPRKSRRRHRHREHKEEGDDEEEEEEGNEEGEDDRERRRRRKRRKEKHSSRRHHHKKSKRRKRHHSSEEENGSPEDVDADGARAPSKKRRSVHRERRHPSEQDEEEDWHGEMDGPDDEGRMERARGRRGQRRMSRGGDMWGMRGMEEQQEEQGYGSSGADSWEEEMRKYKAHQAGFVDEESEEEEMSPRMAGAQRGRGRGRGRGKPPPGAKHSFIQEKLKKIALAAKMKGKGRGRGSGPPGPKPPKEPVGEKKMMLHLICKFYLEGRCKKGENCTYSHDLTQQRKQELCKFYVSGFCNKGDTCLYMHGDFPCKYFHSGSECYQGEKCRFSHEPLNPHTKMLLEKSLSSFEEFQDGPPRSPSKTKGLLPTPGDTSHIPSLLDIDVQPPQLEEPPGPMSFYGADNPEYADPSQQGPDQGDYQGQFQDQQGGPGPYSDQYQQQQQYPQDQDQYQDPYEMVNQFVSLARSNHDQAQNQDSTRRGQDQQDVDSNRGQETTPLPSSQSEDNSASSDKEISSSDFHPRERKTQLPSPPTDNSTKSPPQEEMEQSGQQDTSAPTSSSASRPVQGELSPEPSPPQGSPAGQKPEKQSIPASIPAKQKALFMRIQQKQHDGKTGSDVNSESDDNSKHKSSQDEALWYSSDEEERAKKKSSSAKKMNEPVITPKDSAEKTSDPGLPADTGLSSDAVKKLTAIQIPSALANLFAGKTTPTTPSSSGNQVTFNLLDFVKKGPAASKPAPLTPTSPQTEILDSPMSPVNEEFRLIECIREPGRPDPRSGREKRDKSDMRFRVLHWKDNKYSINDPDDRPSLQPIELTTPTELKGQPNFPKTTLSQFMPGNQMAQPSMTVPPSQGPIDPRMKRDPRLARMQGLEEAAGPKDPRMNRDPRSMASNVPNMPDMGINNMPPPLLPMPDERMRHMGPGPRPSPQDGLLPMPPGGPRPPLGPLPPFMPGPRGMLPPFGGPLPPMGRFPQDMPPPDMNMPPRGPPFQGPGPRMGPGPGHGQHPPFIRTPLIRQMSDGSGNVSGPPNFQGGPGPGDLPMNRFRGPSPNDPRGNVNDPRNINPRQAAPDPRQAAQDPRDQRQAAQDPRSQRQIAQDPRDPRQMAQDPRGQNQTVQDPRDPRQTVQGPRDPRQMAQDPRDPRQGLQESRDPRLAQTDSRDPRKGPPAESRDPRLMRQMSSNKPGGGSPSQSDNLPAQDIDERLNIPKLQDVDLRRQVPDRKAKLQGFSIPKLPKRCDVAEADTTSGDPDNLGGSGGISHRKVPSAHHGLPQGLSSFDVGGKTRTNFPSGDPRTNSGRDSPQMTLQIQIPGNGEGDGDMAAAIAQLAEEPDIQLKDMFKTQDPTASPFC